MTSNYQHVLVFNNTIIIFAVCNFGQEWEVAEASAVTQYKAGTRQHIHAEIGVKIGLRSVNITLRGKPKVNMLD